MSDNTERIARAVAEALGEIAGDPATSAGVILAVLAEPNRFPPGSAGAALQRQLTNQVMPSAAKNWQQMLTLPMPDDLEANGLGILYEATVVCGTRVLPVIDSFINQALPEYTRTWLGEPRGISDEYFTAVIGREVDLEDLVTPADPLFRARLDQPELSLMQLEPMARGTLAMLLFPLFGLITPDPDGNALQRFVRAAAQGYHTAAVNMLNEWQPAAAHEFLIRHVVAIQAPREH